MSEIDNTATAEMMIRKPIAEVFEAFIDPAITTKFWFTKSTGKLEAGKQVDWIWEMYQLTVPVLVKTIEVNKRILIEWGEGADKSSAEWTFKYLAPAKTFVKIINADLQGKGAELTNRRIDSTGGFTMVLAGLKAWLEHRIELNLIGDKFPKELMDNND